ncbi:MAG TPA: SDR family NAD(P)-dependent oxidoreductase [Bryobacteraceae bacterium]|nr:SDR family NAD(P)-dependent oxidoreductase [Bryobacteraceae bacterium]
MLAAEQVSSIRSAGSSSVKGTYTTIFDETLPALFIAPSGQRPNIEPEEYAAVDLQYLRKLGCLSSLADHTMRHELNTHRFDFRASEPPPKTLCHALIPNKFVDHVCSEAMLTLAQQPDSDEAVRHTFGDDVIVLPYYRSVFDLAKATVEAYDGHPNARAIIWMFYGILTWGDTAAEVYSSVAELVTRAEEYVAQQAKRSLTVHFQSSIELAKERAKQVCPIVRGALAQGVRGPREPLGRTIVRPLIDAPILQLLSSERGKDLAFSPPLAGSDLAILKPFPLWLESPEYDDSERLRNQFLKATAEFAQAYEAYFARNASALGEDVQIFDLMPRLVFLPGMGVLCIGPDVNTSTAVCDIVRGVLKVKAGIAEPEGYKTVPEMEQFRMEYGLFSPRRQSIAPGLLAGRTAMVTGAAGAIGAGICESLMRQGCAVALADLPGEGLTTLVEEFRKQYPDLAMELPFDVTNPDAVSCAFEKIILTWGGLDLVVLNAGIAHVSSLADMQLGAFQKLERVNIEGTLNILSECARHFRLQGSGGDIVLISTKNVFAPGAKFGAYSATKAAAHQLARIASLEFAELKVRVNMVAPDAVFGHGSRQSGLWASVGADRARSLGMEAEELEAYYQSRNLLKTKITAADVGNAVLYFATQQSPTTGVTISVDGGLPAATPR